MKVTKARIREYLHHNGAECRVRIKKDGTVERHGSPDPFDRSRDFWAYMGTVAELTAEIQALEKHR